MARPVNTDKFKGLSSKVKNGTLKTCTCCGEERKYSEYYKSSNPYHSDALFPTCKTCILDQFDETSQVSVYDTLRRMDKPFIEDKWIAAENSSEGKAVLGNYFKSISISSMSNLTWDDSEFPESEDDDELSQASKTRWVGFSSAEKIKLEAMYQEMLSAYEADTPVKRNLYRSYVITLHKSDEALFNGNVSEYEKLQRTASSQMGDARIKPLQETGFDENSTATFGQFMEKIENERPIPEPLDIFEDVDGIKKYMTKWFTNQMQRALDLRSKNDDIESVLDGDK
ncbi:hypothetical protein EVJ32_04525 [Exiguobacterium sp. SH5S4]|uniref:hypothetical protein n=1 Tax=Exiguobacterium sp. SH5S4 TaxID=2510961 RepID=UPI001039247F|nr:hypothetical protein [Exiguobacterium sp. SH5S4]TCI26642.1 hypothetical protein EVJ32_04525 [Exiguobacterium sp. SH5S4]